MKKSDIFRSKWLKADDIGDAEIRVTISKAEMEELGFGDERELKPVVYFEGKQKALVVNLTNYDSISRICGSDDTDGWPGTTVVLYTAPATFRGKTAPAIRIKASGKPSAAGAMPLPRPPQTQGNSDLNDEIPF